MMREGGLFTKQEEIFTKQEKIAYSLNTHCTPSVAEIIKLTTELKEQNFIWVIGTTDKSLSESLNINGVQCDFSESKDDNMSFTTLKAANIDFFCNMPIISSVELYRIKSNNDIECMVRLFCDIKALKKANIRMWSWACEK